MGADTEISLSEKIVLYDGVCNFCNGSVNFIIKHEKTSDLKFAALQSEFAQKLIKKDNFESSDFDSIIYTHQDELLIKSKAAFEIAKTLKTPWSCISIFKFLPTTIADFFYDLIARNRYRIFGKSDTCIVPSSEIRSRFLDH